jgi:transposase
VVMRPYSQDLRERVLAALEAGDQSQAEIAETFAVSLSTIEKSWRRWRQTGTWTARPHAGGVRRALREGADFLRAEVQKQPDVTLDELRAQTVEANAIKASPSMICRELREPRLPRYQSRSRTASGIRHGCGACGVRSPHW